MLRGQSRLDAVFQRLYKHKLKLKGNKCGIFGKEVIYLGHIVSEDGIKIDWEKIKVLQDWPIKDDRKYLDYRQIIKRFVEIVRPLNDLLIVSLQKVKIKGNGENHRI